MDRVYHFTLNKDEPIQTTHLKRNAVGLISLNLSRGDGVVDGAGSFEADGTVSSYNVESYLSQGLPVQTSTANVNMLFVHDPEGGLKPALVVGGHVHVGHLSS